MTYTAKLLTVLGVALTGTACGTPEGQDPPMRLEPAETTTTTGPSVAVGYTPNGLGDREHEILMAAWTDQQALGYSPCRPEMRDVDTAEDGADLAGWAMVPPVHPECIVAFAPDLPDELVAEIAWHETCHLSTIPAIHADMIASVNYDPDIDYYHDDLRFVACLDIRGAR